jgi:hypothetical protein
MFIETKRGLRITGFVGYLDWAEVLVEKLNKLREQGSNSEIVTLVRNLIYIDTLARRCRYPEEISFRIYEGEFGQDAIKALKYAQQFFVKHNYSLVLEESGAQGWLERYTVPAEYHGSLPKVHKDTIVSGDAYWLPLAVWKAAVGGQLSRIRECRHCQKWFLSKRIRQNYCSAGCRQQAFRATPTGKRKRAAYMRAYRLKNPNAR